MSGCTHRPLPRLAGPCRACTVLLAVLLLAPAVWAQQTISLMAPEKAWSFNHGGEFPGATGKLTITQASSKEGAVLGLVGDFTRGGKYVQAGRKIDNVEVRELSMWVRNPDAATLTVRLNDASGQTHQIVLAVKAQSDWQRVVLPLERFFARRGQADAVTSIAKYESWGAPRRPLARAGDGAVHPPGQPRRQKASADALDP